MINAKNLSRITLVSVLLSMKTVVEGSIQWCPTNASVILTRVPPSSLAFLRKSIHVLSQNATWFKYGETYGYPCRISTCVQLCCPLGYAARANECVMDDFTTFTASKDNQISSSPHPHEFVDDPWILNSMKSGLHAHRLRLFLNQSIILKSDIRRINFEGYCMIRAVNSSRHFIGTCVNNKRMKYPLILWGGRIVLFGGMSISILFAIASFIVYTVIPELKNLRGKIVRCYLAAYINCLFVFAILLGNGHFFRYVNNLFIILCALLSYYFGIACVCWLNVMSIDIWRTFRKIRSNRGIDLKKRDSAKFVWYSIYAWVSPVVLFLIFVCVQCTSDAYGSTGESYVMYSVILLVFSIGISNTYLYISTALRINQRKKETAHLVDGVNKHHKESEQWFNLYLKLYIIMGGTAIIWAAVLYVRTYAVLLSAIALEGLQGFCIFIVLVWRDEVKRYFRK